MVETLSDLKLQFQRSREYEAKLLEKVCGLQVAYYRVDDPELMYEKNISQGYLGNRRKNNEEKQV